MYSALDLSLEELDKYIEELKVKQKEYEETHEGYYIDNDYHTIRTPYCEQIRDLLYERYLRQFGYKVERCQYGYIIDGKYIITRKGRWKVKWKNTWYWYKSIDDLFERYINKPYGSRENKEEEENA